jgi:hypothetical protein
VKEARMTTTITEALPGLLAAFDEDYGNDFSKPALLLMIFEAGGDAFDFAVKELAAGQHPLDELLGFAPPEGCLAIGTISHGWATTTVGPRPSKAKDRRRIRALHVVCQDGSEVGGFHLAGGELALQPVTVGMVPDALRRALGLATSPPESSPAELSAADWLDAIADDKKAARRPPEPFESWDEPRWQVVTRERLVPGLSPTVAAWMDAGIFARWMAPTYPRLADHLAAVRRLVDATTYREVTEVIRAWKLEVTSCD